jgi:hypothetical protein
MHASPPPAPSESTDAPSGAPQNPDRVAYEFVGDLEIWQPVSVPPADPPTPVQVSLLALTHKIFTQIEAMHSALLAVSKEGKIYRWGWDETSCAGGPHPRASALGLVDDIVVSIVACSIRASFLTATGKIATIMDDIVVQGAPSRASNEDSALKRLEHPATRFPQFDLDGIQTITVCETMTCVLTQSGR